MQKLMKTIVFLGSVTILPLSSHAQFVGSASPTTVLLPIDGATYYVKNQNTYVDVTGTSVHNYKITGPANTNSYLSISSVLNVAGGTAGASLMNWSFTTDSDGIWRTVDYLAAVKSVNVGGYTAKADSELNIGSSTTKYSATASNGFSVVITPPPPPPGS